MTKTRGEVARFLGAGLVGAVVDIGLLYVFIALGVSPNIGRIPSVLSSMFTTWRINRRYTFGAINTGQSQWMEWWKYMSAMTVGFCINYVIFSIVLYVGPPGPYLPMAGVMIGAAVAMVFNFVSARKIIRNH